MYPCLLGWACDVESSRRAAERGSGVGIGCWLDWVEKVELYMNKMYEVYESYHCGNWTGLDWLL
jgi:hypothetical protein